MGVAGIWNGVGTPNVKGLPQVLKEILFLNLSRLLCALLPYVSVVLKSLSHLLSKE